ncbi:MAG: hypothetical protein WEE89_06985 [Gemmatimonadota bacterium]
MDHLVVVTHPSRIALEARPVQHDAVPEGAIALGYYHDGHLVARGMVSPDAIEAIHGLLAKPVSLALAAAEDDHGNIDARVCVVLPIEPGLLQADAQDDEPQEPWQASIPVMPEGIEAVMERETGSTNGEPKLALLPIGNVVRGKNDRKYPESIAEDAREMLDTLVHGQAQDAVRKAIDDLLRSI